MSGTGTDTQKTQVFNGISELLGGNRQVTFNFTTATNAAGVPAYLNTTTASTYSAMVVWSPASRPT